jgi:hypothetical protein
VVLAVGRLQREINIDRHCDTGSLIKLREPETLRALAAVADILADAIDDPDTLDESHDPVVRCG